MSQEQEMNLASILAIVTNPEMVAKNIQKLQEDMANAHVALKDVEDKHAEAVARHDAAKIIEDAAEKRHNDLDVRENELKKKEQHWLDKDTQQKEAEKAFNEIKLQHAARVRDAEQKETANAKGAAALDERETAIVAKENEIAALHEEALALKKAYEAKVASIRDFASQVG